MKLRLVQNGIFPVTTGLDGSSLQTATKLPVAGTIQGEGKLAGTPSLFVRFSGCNLRCAWYRPDGKVEICDTPYSSHHPDEVEEWDTDDIIRLLLKNKGNIRHVVITGGEPMMQASGVSALAASLRKNGFHITVETNATWFDADVARHTDLISMSPKLNSAIPFGNKISAMKRPIDPESTARHRDLFRNVHVIQQFIDACYQDSFYGDRPDSSPVRRADKDFQLKFVVSTEDDIREIEEEYLARLHGFSSGDILLMPLGADVHTLQKTSPIALQAAIERGWHFSPRLHIDLFGNVAGT